MPRVVGCKSMAKPNQIILKLEGGLGNQLFQLAAGYFLASKNSSDLLLDQYSIRLTTVHGEKGIGFNEFVISEFQRANKIVLLRGLPGDFLTKLAKQIPILKKLLLKIRMWTSNPKRLPLFIETNEEESKENLLVIESPIKLHGNFQSWDIVEKSAQFGFPRILHLKETPDWIQSLQKRLDFKDSIVLHFRVGDDTRANHNFRQPDFSYYFSALEILKAKVQFSNVYVLSDDLNRVKEMYGSRLGGDIEYLSMPTESSPAERLYVLSLFGGIVCANSTFCGWAAWSISNSGGAVVVPVPYSDGPVLGSRDFPSGWIKLDKYSGAEVA